MFKHYVWKNIVYGYSQVARNHALMNWKLVYIHFVILSYIYFIPSYFFLVLIFHQIIDFQAKSELPLAYYERYCCKCCIQGIPSVRIFQIAFWIVWVFKRNWLDALYDEFGFLRQCNGRKRTKLLQETSYFLLYKSKVFLKLEAVHTVPSGLSFCSL